MGGGGREISRRDVNSQVGLGVGVSRRITRQEGSNWFREQNMERKLNLGYCSRTHHDGRCTQVFRFTNVGGTLGQVPDMVLPERIALDESAGAASVFPTISMR